ncbi:RagB/SusD family nutrient uptake outer membrane protein [Chryseolinea lacunae]|uniref:RagB/SusD family nutrient uptake outer membrane protein n=1 Tax=Chryseolinea lacunae TaxID=2801331 RepID=A0ABS1L3X5_9BACT|nr:RagB/SusD family nutrient uptake outer membrane protein [Chryseolinea lacunae]MBL0745266.1 RagB/SusD family nutrient uptake outer membrane protein [Chryseolinea lacunae]
MKNLYRILFTTALCIGLLPACKDTLEPKPVDILTDDVVLNEPADVNNVEIGLYNAFRTIAPATVIAGDATADMLINNGTFTQYQELGTKQITSANASVATLWSSIYQAVYIANFILERLPKVEGVPTSQRDKVMATAHFLRGYAYFIAAYSFGAVPLVTTTAIDDNRNIGRTSRDEILAFVLADYTAALGKLPTKPVNTGFAGEYAVQAALARFHLYQENWADAEKFATQVITSKQYSLDTAFVNVVTRDFPAESILEAAYTLTDDPGTNGNIGLNNLFVGRREIIPSNPTVVALASDESGDRFSSISFNADNLKGNDNGWSVAKYGTADQDNNNVIFFRLGEMYLIRAEARAQQDKVTGDNTAQTDINVLRARAKAPQIGAVTKSQMIQLIENERRYELAFEGHRWYDLVRTGRASAVMAAASPNWQSKYELWPVPQREIQNNPALVGNQNPGY